MSRQAINLGAPLREVDHEPVVDWTDTRDVRVTGVPKALVAEFKRRKSEGLEIGSFSHFLVKSAMKQAEDWR